MLLAIDTASRVMSLALHDGRSLHYEASWRSANNHTIELTSTIQAALAQARVAPGDLVAVAVAQGPGSFTGLRIGLGVAKGLALAQDLPLVAVPTLSILAAGVPVVDAMLVAVLQAGRGRVCAQLFAQSSNTWEPVAEPEITTWQDLIETIDSDTLIAGEIDDQGHTLLDNPARPCRRLAAAWSLRRAGFLAEIAWARFRAGQTDDPATITPLYLHRPGVPHP